MFDFDILNDSICLVVFTKKDGSVRKMRCTKNESYISEEYRTLLFKYSGNDRKKNENLVSVIDLDIMEWRSFNKDQVISFERED